MTSLFDALASQDLATFLRIVVAEDHVNETDRMGRTPLMYAVADGLMDFVTLLLEHGADVNSQDKQGWTALHFAAQEYDRDMVSTLLQHGAKVDAQDSFGNTPLWRAVFSAEDKGGAVVELLLSNGADKNLKNGSGISPIELARSIGNYDVASYIDIHPARLDNEG